MNKIIGHEEEINSLKNIINSGKISNAYLFCGIDGIGKFIIAKEFAKSILCLNSIEGSYCDNCDACKSFNSSSDLVVLESEDNEIKVDAVRSLCKEIMLKPTISNKRVFIVNDADTMNDSAQNALLKSLEEPPRYATIILIASNKSMLKKTILSRCVTIDFKALTKEELIEISKLNNSSFDNAIFDYSAGSYGRALKIVDCGYLNLVQELESAIKKGDLVEMNKALINLKKNKTIKEHMNDVLNLLINRFSKNIDDNTALTTKQISIFEEVRNNINKNINFEDSLDYMIIRLWEESNRRS